MGTTDAQIGWATETVPGTAVTVTEFLPWRPGTQATRETRRYLDDSVLAGRLTIDQNQRGTQVPVISNTIKSYMYDRGMLALLRAMFGDVATSGVGPYVHAFTLGDLADDTLTVQVGAPTVGGAQAFTHAGCVPSTWTLDCVAGQAAELTVNNLAQTEVTGTALATAAVPSGLVRFETHQVCVNVDAGAIQAKSVRFNGDNQLTQEQYLCETTKEIGDRTARPVITGELSIPFVGLAEFNKMTAGTLFDLQVVMTAGANTVVIDAKAEYDSSSEDSGQTPTQTLPFTVMSAAGGPNESGWTMTITNSQATA